MADEAITTAEAAVPDDAAISFVNWVRGRRRPTKRFPTAAEALTEAARLRKAFPTESVFTFRLERIDEAKP